MRYTYIQATSPDGRMPSRFQERPEDDSVVLVAVYEGEAGALDHVFRLHNQPDRPHGESIRSMVVGDLVVVHPTNKTGPKTYLCDTVGWTQIHGMSAVHAEGLALRQPPAHRVANGEQYWDALLDAHRP